MRLKTNLILTAAFAFYSILACPADASASSVQSTPDTTYSIAKKADGKLIFLPPHDPVCALGLTNVGNTNSYECASFRMFASTAVIMYARGQHEPINSEVFVPFEQLVNDDQTIRNKLFNPEALYLEMRRIFFPEHLETLVCIMHSCNPQALIKSVCIKVNDGRQRSTANPIKKIKTYQIPTEKIRSLIWQQMQNRGIAREYNIHDFPAEKKSRTPLFMALLESDDTHSKEFQNDALQVELTDQTELTSAIRYINNTTTGWIPLLTGKPYGATLAATLDCEKLDQFIRESSSEDSN